jgi:hypothetical protein
LVIQTTGLMQAVNRNLQHRKQQMNTNLKKRKKAAFNNYKAVRTNIYLNKLIIQPEYAWQQNIIANNYENIWIEQATELRSEISTTNQTFVKQNRLITNWWEKN